MLLSAIVVGLLLAGLIVPVILSRTGGRVRTRPQRASKPAKPAKSAAKPPLRLVVRPDDMDSELKKLLEEDRR